MGQPLSCVSKKPKSSDEEKKPKKNKSKKGKTDVILETKIESQQNATPGLQTSVVTYLESAPSNFKLPPVAKSLNQTKDGQVVPTISTNSQRDSKDVLNTSGVKLHLEQPVDHNARSVASGNQKPKCWKDLYWNLIESKGLKTDEEKVRVLFSWLCSIPPIEEIFKPSITDDEQGKDHKKTNKTLPDSPDVVLEKLSSGKANYVQAFESICRYSGITCVTIRGIAKSMDYRVGQTLLNTGEKLFDSETGTMPPKISGLQHSWNAAYVDGTWCLFDCTWAAQRLAVSGKDTSARTSQAMTLQYETDMFYYKVNPAELIYTHYPFEDNWQLLTPPISIIKFATWPLIKPAFFQYGLSLFSHQEGCIPTENQLVVKLKMCPENAEKLLFTYQLNLQGMGNIDAGANMTRFGMHEISPDESLVIFHLRFPKKGEYNLIIYARLTGEQLFSDVCEYLVSNKGKSNGGPLDAMPFPPTAQASYGPTEKAVEYCLETLPNQLHPLVKSPNGSVELRFVSSEPGCEIPRLTARLKSLNVKADKLENCILLREIEASLPPTGVSMLTGLGPCVPMSVLNAYLPEPGEYALEVYAAPHSTEDPTAYYLAWQFLIEAEKGKPLSEHLRSRLATINLGAQDRSWQDLGFKAISHPDPVIRVRTTGWAGSERLLKKYTKTQVLQRFMGSTAGGKKQPNDQSTNQPDEINENGDDEKPVSKDEEDVIKSPITDQEASDLLIILGLPEQDKIHFISQLVDISGDEELDVTGYVLQRNHAVAENDEDLSGDRMSKSLTASFEQPSQLISILVRIPKGGCFYKLYLYAVPRQTELVASIPLIYTYLIDAPLRMQAAELPYIGSTAGEFPEKIEKRKAAELNMEASKTHPK